MKVEVVAVQPGASPLTKASIRVWEDSTINESDIVDNDTPELNLPSEECVPSGERDSTGREPCANNTVQNVDFEEKTSSSAERNEPGPDNMCINGKNQSTNASQSATGSIFLLLQKDITFIDKRKTVLTQLVRNKTIYNLLSNIYTKRWVSVALSVLWFLCSINYMFITVHKALIPTYYYVPIQLILTTTFIIHHSAYIRVDITKRLTKSFSFWFSIYNIISVHICYFMLWGISADTVCAEIHSITSVMFMLLFDAHAAKRRNEMKYSIVVAILSFVPVFAVLTFSLRDFGREVYLYGSHNVEIINIRLQALENLTSLIIYLFRIMHNHLSSNRADEICFLSSFYEIKSNKESFEKLEVAQPEMDLMPAENRMLNVLGSPGECCRSKSQKITESASPVQRCESGKEQNNIDDNPEPGLARFEGNNEFHLKFGVFEERTVEYDPHRTIFHKYISGKFKLVTSILRSRQYNIIGIAASLFSLIISLPLASGLSMNQDIEFLGVVTSFFGIFFILVQTATTCNLFMAAKMVQSFDYWYIIFQMTKTFFSAAILCRWDKRVLFWVLETLVINWSIMVDTFHIKSRKLTYLNLLGAMWVLSAAVLCKFNIGETYSSDYNMEFQGLKPVSIRMILSTSLMSSFVFSMRFIWSYHKNPNRILFMTANLRVEEPRK